MTDQELERRLRQALDAATPDDLDGVLSRCAPRAEAVVPFRPRRKSHARALIAACLTLVLVGGTRGRLLPAGPTLWPLWSLWTSTPASS